MINSRLLLELKKYNNSERLNYLELFKKLSKGQKPDAIFIGCSDSRLMPNLFSHESPGELFMVRNVGNLIPKSNFKGETQGDESEGSAIEYGIGHLDIDDIIVCGHSSCGAIKAIYEGRNNIHFKNLKEWLRHGENVSEIDGHLELDLTLSPVDQLSQLNVILQIENLKTYPIVQERLREKKLRLHAWWFQIETAKIFIYDENSHQFKFFT